MPRCGCAGMAQLGGAHGSWWVEGGAFVLEALVSWIK